MKNMYVVTYTSYGDFYAEIMDGKQAAELYRTYAGIGIDAEIGLVNQLRIYRLKPGQTPERLFPDYTLNPDGTVTIEIKEGAIHDDGPTLEEITLPR